STGRSNIEPVTQQPDTQGICGDLTRFRRFRGFRALAMPRLAHHHQEWEAARGNHQQQAHQLGIDPG
ncbi:hypothetical protein, partial [uncultured Arthrobacter sp.]|uniref:hypothetical protein n=1 Tax=uncultured Arthrobacter sp. TaxID=114050 RepID=UPI0028D3D622